MTVLYFPLQISLPLFGQSYGFPENHRLWTMSHTPLSDFVWVFWKSHSSVSVRLATAVADVLSLRHHSNALLVWACAVLLLHKGNQRKKNWIKKKKKKHAKKMYCLRQHGLSISIWQHMLFTFIKFFYQAFSGTNLLAASLLFVFVIIISTTYTYELHSCIFLVSFIRYIYST